MDKIKNFDIVVNTCLADIESRSKKSDFDKNDFLLSVVNGFEDGKWREDLFRQFVMNNIAQTGLSADERENICTIDPYTQITRSIMNLRLVDCENGQGSEIAEIVLYGIMRYHYNALPVVPKIFYKQNSNDNAKGADSVHIVIDEDKMDFTLWLGEAKFFNDIIDERLYDPINSVFEALGTEKIKKENSIITNIKDLEYVINNPDIRKKVKEVLRISELNSNINEHLNRTAAIENMGAFFEREINQVAAREQYINEVVAKVDDTLRKTFEKLAESTRESVTQLRNNSVSEFDALLKHYSEQKEEFARMLQEQREEFAARNAETTELMKEIRNLADIKAVMGQLVESTKGQTAILERLVSSLKNQNNGGRREGFPIESAVQHVSAPVFPKSITYMVATITLLAFMAFGLYVYNSFIAEPRIEVVGVSNEPQQTIVPTSTQVEPNISNDQTVNVDSLESTQSATQEQ